MAEFIYQMYQARKAVGDKVILDDVTLSFYPGAKIGVVGPNGMGKSTLLKVMAGLEEVSNGDARLTPGYTVGILQQEPPLDEDKTVLENIQMAFADVLAKVARFNEIGEEMAAPDADFDALMDEMGKLQDEIDAANGWDLDSQLSQAMDALQCPDPNAPVTILSGGERRRVALCRLLLEAPDLLLLDEPTNHLDAESVLWLEQFLKNYPGAVLAVTHDRYFLDHVAEWICEVDRGQLFPYKGNYSTYLETKAARIAAQGQAQAKLARRMEKELEWVRSSPKARQAKSKARLANYEAMVAEAARAKKLDFAEIQIPVGPRLGSKVLVAKNLHKEFDGRVLIDDLSFELPRNGIVGVIGPNGVGKTTLFKTIVGLEPLTSGELELGETVKISYVDQNREGIDPNTKLWEVVSGGTDYMMVGETEIPSRAYVAAFGFKGADQQKPAGVLSGGERNRLNLALTLKEGGNLLLLDEPTNDLDVETLSSLEAALLDFPGCSVVVSHDRMFLDRIATHILAWEGDDENPGRWHFFEGNFESYQEDREARLGKEAAKPHRLHRKLTRD
ncbi:energy-dependent translational throttle protein EttA [Adlercreutzia muris]|uniref:Energy-dependent translational throttle protein EttA n=1 Tax=Adlercreutzia muris TaxID=1796610 RepID=A0A7C8FS75_9ACTN|nr:energy-dependent translational throttle protein EttA [Adlercreutzia muris]MCI8305964.1 energy-dependent translational throttle protein EttA [Enterorhabdus sp.]TGY74676.1 energy-dependent translational throttle protein EttA [Enterorhabdus sp. NM05_H27]KAB1643336.1 energy-dependent translational throttle protein EttA [Adlercreutzia muris]MCR2029067.1 energy-dependent translational throttle protein EttA [Adlercreutzia muris]NCA32618.1 energy-dependent translational throttle protein EttA [Adler